MAVITTGNHPAALWPGINKFFGRQYDQHDEEYVHLFDIDTSKKNYEEDVELTGFGLAPVKDQGSAVIYDSEAQSFTKRYTHTTYALGYIVTWEELNDVLYEIVSKRRARALAFSMRQTVENIAANVYNRASNSSYTGGDGVELLSTAHTSNAGTWSNALATAADISETALEDLVIQIMGATNQKGLKISLMPRSLLVPRQLWFESNRILKSTLQNDSAENALNVLKSTNAFPEGIKVNHYLTDPDAFFIRANIPSNTGLRFFWRHKTDFAQDNDFDTSNAKAKSVFRISVGWTDPRGLWGSPGV